MLSRCITVIWAIWYTLVGLSNLFDALKNAGVLAPAWRFASGNYDAVTQCTATYAAPPWLVAGLFVGVLVLEFSTAAAFWRAALGKLHVKAALTLAVLVWGCFIIADEAFVCYAFANTHVTLLCAQLLSYIAVSAEQQRVS